MSAEEIVTQANTDVTGGQTVETKGVGDVAFGDSNPEPEVVADPVTTEPDVTDPASETNKDPSGEPVVDENDISITDLGLAEELAKEISDHGFDIPEGVKLLNEFSKENNLTKEQRAGLSKFYVEKFVKPQIQLMEKAMDRDFDSLLKTYGSEEDLKKAQPIALKGANAFFGKETDKAFELLATAGLSFNRVFYNAMYKHGLAQTEDSSVKNPEFTHSEPKKTVGTVIFGENAKQ